MKNNTAVFVHNKLNELYSNAEEVFEYLKNTPNIQASYGFFNGNYTKIYNRYEYQKYPIPVISIENKGDIGFDLNAIWFEFFVPKTSLTNHLIEELIHNYNVEIYGGKNCLINFYNCNKTNSDILETINNSNEETIGISISLGNADLNNIKDYFFNICSLLNI